MSMNRVRSWRWAPLLFSIFFSVEGLQAQQAAGVEDSAERSVDAILTVKPTSCVALHRGQSCYQEITLSWYSAEANRLCLFTDSQAQPLYCAHGETNQYVYQYSSASSETYSLRRGEDGPVVAQAVVSTSWVYRTGRRSSSGWRLF